MKNGDNISDEYLNSFVDDELDDAERNQLFEALDRDPQINARVHEARRLKELIQYAYSVPFDRHDALRRTSSRLFLAFAATLLLATGVVGGWILHGMPPVAPDEISRVASAVKKQGVVIQVSEHDPAKWNIALLNAKNIRNEFPAEKMDNEIVAYGGGLAMLKKTGTEHDRRLEAAARAGVKLLACGNTMRDTHTSKAELNPVVEVVKAGVVEIMQKQQQGYSYIRP